jgi:hypothetical protein
MVARMMTERKTAAAIRHIALVDSHAHAAR